MRDEFSSPTRNALALRANHKCSFTDCRQPTSGPSDLAVDAVTQIGVAAHIHAASPGGPRYLESMTPEERSSIANAIWLCPTHSTLIDRDTAAYTADAIRQMKSAHEQRVTTEMSGATKSEFDTDLVAIGADLVFSGELIGVNGDEWQLRIHHFITGDISTLISFGEHFEQIDPYERYILVNALGDGRQLSGAPAFLKSASGYVVTSRVCKSFPRINAHDLPKTLALNDAHDIFLANGSIAIISGLDALPQQIKSCLSLQRGESPFYPTLGARIKDYFDLFRDSPWLAHLIKLEVIRHACVPYKDQVGMGECTPLMSVSRVHDVEILPYDPTKDWLPFRFLLTVEGIGQWQRDISIFIPRGSQ